jgi:hypothetical protein
MVSSFISHFLQPTLSRGINGHGNRIRSLAAGCGRPVSLVAAEGFDPATSRWPMSDIQVACQPLVSISCKNSMG